MVCVPRDFRGLCSREQDYTVNKVRHRACTLAELKSAQKGGVEETGGIHAYEDVVGRV